MYGENGPWLIAHFALEEITLCPRYFYKVSNLGDSSSGSFKKEKKNVFNIFQRVSEKAFLRMISFMENQR